MAVSAWTKHLKTDEDKAKYLQSLHKAEWLLKDIRKLISTSDAAIDAAEISPKSYDNPNWAYRQAHANGYKQALRDFNKLLTLTEE